MSAKAGPSGCRLPPIVQGPAATVELDSGLLHKLEVLGVGGEVEKDQLADLEETFDSLSDEVSEHHFTEIFRGTGVMSIRTSPHQRCIGEVRF